MVHKSSVCDRDCEGCRGGYTVCLATKDESDPNYPGYLEIDMEWAVRTLTDSSCPLTDQNWELLNRYAIEKRWVRFNGLRKPVPVKTNGPPSGIRLLRPSDPYPELLPDNMYE